MTPFKRTRRTRRKKDRLSTRQAGVLGLLTAGYVVVHEGLHVPLLQPSQFTLKADFSTTKAVVPGQGVSVRVSGVEIGTVTGVALHQGDAQVTMAIDSKYDHLVHTDATALLRPRTGLDDMFVELDPGRPPAPVARPGFTLPVGATQPPVDSDQILSSLDADTRGYLDLLVNGAGQGLAHDGGSQLAQVLDRFEPTHRDLARLNGAIATRGAAVQGLVTALGRLNGALAAKRTQIVSLIDSSDQVFHAFAAQDENVSRAVAELPGTLRQTTETLGLVRSFAGELGPTAQTLLPAATALPAANVALRRLAVPSTPIIRTEIRPFVIAARPTVRELRPAAAKLAQATPALGRVFGTLNHFVNLLGYNPGGAQHGYLWWLAWTDHNARSLFSNQDANGDYRNLFLQASCATLAQVANSFGATYELALNLTPILTDAGLCPTQAAADTAAYKRYEASGGSGAHALFDPKLPVH